MKEFEDVGNQCLYSRKLALTCKNPNCGTKKDYLSSLTKQEDSVDVYQSRKCYLINRPNISQEILSLLESKRSIVKSLFQKERYREALSILNGCCFNYMMPRSHLDETQITPYNTEVMDKYSLNGYINASEIVLESNIYIATQIPCLKNLDVFTKLIKNSKTKTIVSLVSNTEHLKSFIKIFSEEKWLDGKLVFHIERYIIEGQGVRILRFENWADHSVISSRELEYFYYAAGVITEYPILVHCRAGIGRTGFFIMYDFLRKKGMVNIDTFLDILFKLRSKRSGTVWSKEQLSYLVSLFVIPEFSLEI
ncbi:Tyrosine-protein phosphatase non-receptor type 20 [Nosema granulosis]|uniref:Tyrosine-protein phosphatase non-receptor type 20 n=1 Tax=Nosema granulosis TaxID=83296 RepID=A0A9P6GX25_9MICR|nr:Tyrosine-protein phosphatase non-receptor type 20 [Nosema granulosis]